MNDKQNTPQDKAPSRLRDRIMDIRSRLHSYLCAEDLADLQEAAVRSQEWDEAYERRTVSEKAPIEVEVIDPYVMDLVREHGATMTNAEIVQRFLPKQTLSASGDNQLPGDVLQMCRIRDWSLHWTARGAYLHLESSELIEAVRGKHGDPLKEAADVLIVLMSITSSNGIAWEEVLEKARSIVDELMTKPRYVGEEYGKLDAIDSRSKT